MKSRCDSNPAQYKRNRMFGHLVHVLGRAAVVHHHRNIVVGELVDDGDFSALFTSMMDCTHEDTGSSNNSLLDKTVAEDHPIYIPPSIDDFLISDTLQCLEGYEYTIVHRQFPHARDVPGRSPLAWRGGHSHGSPHHTSGPSFTARPPYFSVLREDSVFLRKFRGKEMEIAVRPVPKSTNPIQWYGAMLESLLNSFKNLG
ncbi:hypothetical protein J437_LFUL010740 [Ladona fulva]|uniref:Uncharacterized protein n=1 Tax=Ladona fulva TaxID=123851 RepID=A0A8K0KDL9_LADFU|nr:hypothetical protein J437_LFUL010740 [Ladona fulva]